MDSQWGVVAETVKRRRVELGLSQRAAAIRAGTSPTTWGSLEKHANPIDDLTRPKVARALGWAADSIDRMLAGKVPKVDPDSTVPRTLDERVTDLEQQLRDLERLVRQSIPGPQSAP